MNDLNIGIAGPITIAPFRHHFNGMANDSALLPVGMGGTPVVNLVSELLQRGRRVTVFTLDEAVDSEVVLQGEQLKICMGLIVRVTAPAISLPRSGLTSGGQSSARSLTSSMRIGPTSSPSAR